MATPFITARDLDLFQALDRCPLTIRQLLKLSKTFIAPFCSERRLQDRMAQLHRADLVRRFRYASVERLGQFAYTLSPESFHLVHGEEAETHKFAPVAIARHHHTFHLSELLVKTFVAAHENDVTVSDFARENSVCLEVGKTQLYPDSTFCLNLATGQQFRFFVELDNSTEPLTSSKDRDSWQRKIAFYEALQNRTPKRFRVLAVTTKSQARGDNILRLAATGARNPSRALVYAVHLPQYLAEQNPLHEPIFHDHRGLRACLMPSPLLLKPTPSTECMAEAVGVC